jgi:hypothetical protein
MTYLKEFLLHCRKNTPLQPRALKMAKFYIIDSGNEKYVHENCEACPALFIIIYMRPRNSFRFICLELWECGCWARCSCECKLPTKQPSVLANHLEDNKLEAPKPSGPFRRGDLHHNLTSESLCFQKLADEKPTGKTQNISELLFKPHTEGKTVTPHFMQCRRTQTYTAAGKLEFDYVSTDSWS